jgi:transposase-like protein
MTMLATTQPEVDRTQYSCPNPDCPDFGKINAGNINIHSRADMRLYCTTCKERFSARQGTIFYNLKTDEEKILYVLKMAAERTSLRAISRILGPTTTSIDRWLGRAAMHVNEVNDYLKRELTVTQLQLDELWSFVEKKRQTHRPAIS